MKQNKKKTTTVHEPLAVYAPRRSRARRAQGSVFGIHKLHSMTTPELIETVRAGLPIETLEELQIALGISMDKLADSLNIPKATLHRRKVSGKLAADESDRVVRFARLWRKAVEVLENEHDARDWITTPQFGLGGEVPLVYAGTEVGAREVEDLLGRIEYSVYA